MKRRLEVVDTHEGSQKIRKLYAERGIPKNFGAPPESHPYSFPYPPYETQLKLMKDLYDIVKNKQIGIMESPTGTGKTLSSLCAVLTFLEDENARIEAEIKSNKQKAVDLKIITDELDFDKALEKLKEADKFQNVADAEDEKLEKVRTKVAEARSRYDYFEATDEIDIEDCVRQPTDDPDIVPQLLKVVYATRTHSQIDQLTEELKKTRFAPRVVSLGSRSILCPNKAVNGLCNAAAGDKCRELRETNKCPFYKREKVRLLADHILAGVVRDVHEVSTKSTGLNACGYYASRLAVPFCELVFVPYATLLDDDMRKSVGLTIDEKTVVIVDEAHNLFSNLTDMSSCQINTNQLDSAQDILKRFFAVKFDRTKPADFKHLKQFEMAVDKASKLMQGSLWLKKEKHMKIHEFVSELFGAEGIRLSESFSYVKRENLLSRIHSFCRSKAFNAQNDAETVETKSSLMSFVKKTGKNPKTDKEVEKENDITPQRESSESFPLFQLLEFFSAVCSAGDNFEVIVDLTSTPKKYQLLCLNSGDKFRSVVSSARSTLLMGGTMKPSDLLISMLSEDCGIEKSRIVEHSYNHIIGAKHLRIAVIGGDKNGTLTLTHEIMKKHDTHLRILDSLMPLVNMVNNGLVVFFPSKRFIVEFMAKIKQFGGDNFKKLMSRGLFIEGSSPDVFEKYSVAAKKQKSTLFGVMGGKFSEGVNFSDELSRCVVVVGLPYPNTLTPEFQAKVGYLKSHFKDDSIGSKLPVNMCMTQVNQAIGRVVRHLNDYGIVVLLDNRYSEARHLNLISQWAKPTVMQFKTTVELVDKFQKFKGFSV